MPNGPRGDYVSPFHDTVEVLRWFAGREARVWRWAFLCFACLYLAMVVIVGIWDPDVPPFLASPKRESANEWLDAVATLTISLMACLSLMLAVRYKARLIRLDRTLAMQHTIYYRSRLEREFAEKELRLLSEHAKWENERDEWKAQTQNELYEIILEQVDRGTLGPRPKPQDDDD